MSQFSKMFIFRFLLLECIVYNRIQCFDFIHAMTHDASIYDTPTFVKLMSNLSFNSHYSEYWSVYLWRYVKACELIQLCILNLKLHGNDSESVLCFYALFSWPLQLIFYLKSSLNIHDMFYNKCVNRFIESDKLSPIFNLILWNSIDMFNITEQKCQMIKEACGRDGPGVWQSQLMLVAMVGSGLSVVTNGWQVLISTDQSQAQIATIRFILVGNGCVSCDTFVVMSDSTDNREVWLWYELFYSMMMIFFRLFLERIQIDLREKFKKLCISQPRLTNREKNWK